MEEKKNSAQKALIENLIEDGWLRTPAIIRAFRRIDRAFFVPEDLKDRSYANIPLSIGFEQTISQPLTAAFCLELLQAQEGDKVLDIGAGSGWQASLLAEIVGPSGKVFSIERIRPLLEQAKQNAEHYQFVSQERIDFIWDDGGAGLPSQAPFDRIIAAACAHEMPLAWQEQLKKGGRLVGPVGSSIWLFERGESGKIKKIEYPGFVFVPLLGGKR